MTTWEFKDLMDLPVVSNAAAREIGRVREVLFNPAAHALFGLVVSPAEKDGPLLLIPQRGIRSVKTR
jgi:sporulation protein YlmC with PRC-barrel domain